MNDTDGGRRSYYLEIFLVSMGALLLEVSQTRLISFKLFYYFTYFIIGAALPGIGSGGVIVALSKRVREASLDKIISLASLLAAASVALGFVRGAPQSNSSIPHFRPGGFGKSRHRRSERTRHRSDCTEHPAGLDHSPEGFTVYRSRNRWARKPGRQRRKQRAPLCAWKTLDPGPIHEVLTVDRASLAEWHESYLYEVAPIYDNRPFF